MSKVPIILFSFFALTISLIEIVFGINYSAGILEIIVTVDLYLFLLLWHVGLGFILPRLNNWFENIDDGLFPLWFRFTIPFIVFLETLFLVWLSNGNIDTAVVLTLFLYIFLPSVLLYNKSWVMMFITILWVWFPIEWGVINSTLGDLQMVLMPLDSLLGIFALFWPLITHGRHIPWYDWAISKSDVFTALKTSLWITIAIVPLGLLLNFLTFNPNNLLNPALDISDSTFINAFLFAIFIFYIIFLIQGLMEELLFRDVIFRGQLNWLEQRQGKYLLNLDLGHLMIILSGLLVISIPFWDEILDMVVQVIPGLNPLKELVGSLALPLGEYEGQPIELISNLPLWPFYLLVGVILVLISLIIYHYQHTPLVAALLTSSIIFGFAHFQDFRYVFFAAIAGFGYGYCYYKTKNIVPAAIVHMGVDAIWVLLLTY